MIDRFFRCDPDVVIARQDHSELTIGESRISALLGIMSGISITSDNLRTIAPDRLELLGKAAKLRIRNIMPILVERDSWPKAFTGTVNNHKAVAVFNTEDHDIDYSFETLELDNEQEGEELLHPLGKQKHAITVKSHDAILLVQ